MNARRQRQSFGFKKVDVRPRSLRQRPQFKDNPIKIAKHDMEAINLETVASIISQLCNCPHKNNGTNFYSFEYRAGGIAIEFSQVDCQGQGIIYLENDYKFREIDCIVECKDVTTE